MQTDRMQGGLMHKRTIPAWLLAACCVLALGVSGALAQNAGSKSGTDSLSPSSPGASSLGTRVLPAPVGHAQPRRDAVPDVSDSPYKETPEDRALDRKIKSICKGC
jgi:hypothetical protein